MYNIDDEFTKCPNCNKLVLIEELKTINDGDVCPNCFPKLYASKERFKKWKAKNLIDYLERKDKL